jgi:hypothetical protein
MSAFIIWLLSTGAFWFLTNMASNAIEANIQIYPVRLAMMTVAGITIGALASAVGYGFFVVTILLIVQLWFVRRKIKAMVGANSAVATKYTLPVFLLIAFATAGSYLFSIEACDSTGRSCKRVFFKQLYTPPHLQPPAG